MTPLTPDEYAALVALLNKLSLNAAEALAARLLLAKLKPADEVKE